MLGVGLDFWFVLCLCCFGLVVDFVCLYFCYVVCVVCCGLYGGFCSGFGCDCGGMVGDGWWYWWVDGVFGFCFGLWYVVVGGGVGYVDFGYGLCCYCCCWMVDFVNLCFGVDVFMIFCVFVILGDIVILIGGFIYECCLL